MKVLSRRGVKRCGIEAVGSETIAQKILPFKQTSVVTYMVNCLEATILFKEGHGGIGANQVVQLCLILDQYHFGHTVSAQLLAARCYSQEYFSE